ncbi:hypothetical protein [Streptomyces sp. NPDC048192]
MSNHLYRIYRKVGVDNRRKLRSAMTSDVSSPSPG